MKIQCDVCSSNKASVFCSADEAALCDSCDHRVHHANKLASKHQRFSLVSPRTKDAPLCDVCKDKRAFVFCQQDRAILCKNCDFSIHSCNGYTEKHNRFLFTGIKISSLVSSAGSDTSLTSSCELVPDFKSQPLKKCKLDSVSMNRRPQSLAVEMVACPSSLSGVSESDDFRLDVGISEYLIEMLPGWHFEDFLDPTSAPCAISKGDNSVVAFNNTDSQNLGIWVPQAPQVPKQVPHFTSNSISGNINFEEPDNKQWTFEGFTVPQISPRSANANSKTSKSVWY